MGKTWDGGDIAFDPETWKAVLRVLKPGGMLMAFGGSRTFHRMACAVDDAGFEVRDCLMWLQGQGFAKGLNIALQFEKKLCEYKDGKWFYTDNGEEIRHEPPFRDSNADTWFGWNVNLKPAYEPIILAQRPLEKNNTHNALKYGVAGINVDGARIKIGDDEDAEILHDRSGGKRGFSSEYVGGKGDGKVPPGWDCNKGRWPANVVLSHSPSCVCVGHANAKGYTINRFKDGAKPFGNGAGHEYESEGVLGGEVEVWKCSESCAVRMLDEQSGVSASSHTRHNSSRVGSSTYRMSSQSVGTEDTGTASRYFKTFTGLSVCVLCLNEIKNDGRHECEDVQNAEKTSLKNERDKSTVRAHAVGRGRRGRKDKLGSETTSVCSAESASNSTSAASQCTVPEHVLILLVERSVLAARSVGNLCDSCATATAHALVEVKRNQELASARFPDSIVGCRMTILKQNLASFADVWENTDITPTTRSLKILFGSVQHAIDESIRLVGNARITESAPTRFRYTSKASSLERQAGLSSAERCNHPTVKPIDLMRYLLTLVTMPADTKILDPFMGSGSTLVAAKQIGIECVGIDSDPESCKTAAGRLSRRTRSGLNKRRKMRKKRGK